MMRGPLRVALWFAPLLLLAGCQTIKGWFGPATSVVKPAALLPVSGVAKARVAWRAAVAPAGKSVLYPAVAGNTVWVASGNGQIAGFNGANGVPVARFETKQIITSGLAASAGTVVFGTVRGELMAHDVSGKLLWRVQAPGELIAPPVIDIDKVVVRVGDGAVHAYDLASGKRRWVYQRAAPPLTVRSHGGIVVERGNVYAGFAGGRMVALSAAGGSVLWDATVSLPKGTTELDRVADISSPPVVDDGRACAATYQGRTACFDAARGSLLWGRDISSYAGIAADFRNLYLTDDKHAVMSLDKSTGGTLWRQDRLANRGLTRPLAFGRYIIVGDFEGQVHLLSRDDGAMAGRNATDGSAIVAPPVALDLTTFLVQTRNGGVFALAAE
jgi:outer membrane protein assembly factor BamB